MSALHTAASNLPETRAALEAAWPGVAIKRLSASVDNRSVDSNGGPEFAGVMWVDLIAAGDVVTMVTLGFVTEEYLQSLPPCGVRNRGRYGVRRERRGVSVRVGIRDPHWNGHEREPVAQRIWDLLATTLAPTIWQPPRGGAIDADDAA